MQFPQLHSHEAFANVMGLVIGVVCYLQADVAFILGGGGGRIVIWRYLLAYYFNK